MTTPNDNNDGTDANPLDDTTTTTTTIMLRHTDASSTRNNTNKTTLAQNVGFFYSTLPLAGAVPGLYPTHGWHDGSKTTMQ